MRYVLAVLLAAAVFASGGKTLAADQAVTKAQVLKAIDTFQKDPVSKEGFAASTTIVAFAQKSPLVRISLSKTVVPWMKDKGASDTDTRQILLAAYIAGNVSAQLKSGRPTDEIYAGWEQVLNTYAQLLRINSAAKVEEVEDLKKKDADGSLSGYAEEISKER